MATIQSQLVCDNSTYANYFQWASAVSAAFASFGWVQNNDTGQVMWTGLSISDVAMSGSNATYTYSGLTGLALAVGRALTITGMGNAVNNGTFVITALGAGTFTVVNASGVNASSQSGVVTAAAAAPGSGLFFYEIWKPGDGLGVFYVKLELGNEAGSANRPGFRISIGTGTNGAGTLTGFTMISTTAKGGSGFTFSTTIQYECDFSGDASRIAVLMWRNHVNKMPQLFCIERSVDGSGAYTAAHVTLITVANNQGFSGDQAAYGRDCTQGTLVFGSGVAPNNFGTTADGQGGWNVRMLYPFSTGTANTTAFQGSIPFDTVAPFVGVHDYPLTIAGIAYGTDLAEGVPFQSTVYGSTRTYMPTKVFSFIRSGPFGSGNNQNSMISCMRYD